VTECNVYVEGEVSRLDRVVWSPDLSFTKTFQSGGCFSIYAKKTRVIINREQNSYMVDAKGAELNPANNPKLYADNSINVPRSTY